MAIIEHGQNTDHFVSVFTGLAADIKPARVPCTGFFYETDTGKAYRFYDEWIEIPLGGTASWGTIIGTLADQTDLQSALNSKSTTGHNHDSTYAALAHNHDADYANIVHTHSATGISDSTATGRSIVTAADAAAVRTAAALGDAATKNVGTGAGDVLAGDAVTAHVAVGDPHTQYALDTDLTTHAGAADPHTVYQKESEKAQVNGYASLGADGKVPSAQLPAGSGNPIDSWPIGSVFLIVVDTSPATLLGGGTWAQIAGGKVLVGQTSGDADFDVAEETGGAKTSTALLAHTHTVTDGGHNHTQNAHTHVQDAHSHIENNNSATTGGLAGWAARDTSTNTPVATGYSTATTVAVNQNATPTNNAATADVTVDSAGSGSSFSIMNPWFVVYIWKRTA